MLKQTLNKGISTPIAIGIILILVVLVGGFTWWQYGEMWRGETELPEIELPEKEEGKKEEISIEEGVDNYTESDYSNINDLNNDGKIEKVTIFFNQEDIFKSYISLYFLTNGDNYTEIDRIDSGGFFILGKGAKDINNDGIKEIFLTSPSGGTAAREFHKILTVDFSNNKLKWVEFKDGNIKNNILEEWGYRGRCSYNGYILNKDINNNNEKEVIGLSAAPCGLDVTACGNNPLCDKEELRDKKPCRECSFSVYEWDGSKFLYNKNLSKLAQGKIEIKEFNPPDLSNVCDVCVNWKE